MIIALVGAHSTGKTTLLNNAAVCFPYPTFSKSIPRETQAEFGYTNPEDAVSSVESVKAFQNRMLENFVKRDEGIEAQGATIVLVDRSPIDVWCYSVEWGSKVGIPLDDPWWASHLQGCRDAVQKYLGFVHLMATSEIPIREEAGRASYPDRDKWDKCAQAMLEDLNIPVLTLSSLSLQDRLIDLGQFVQERKSEALGAC